MKRIGLAVAIIIAIVALLTTPALVGACGTGSWDCPSATSTGSGG